MRYHRFALTVALSLLAIDRLPAQSAVPPSEAALDAANLKTEWAIALPIAGQADGIELIQVVEGGQIMVQTRGGLLVALDAKTGITQWTLKFDSTRAPVYPVAVSDRYVVAVNLVSLYCIHRYTGLLEFQYKLPLIPTAAPALDRDLMYVTMNAQNVTVYQIPEALRMPIKRPNPVSYFGNLANATDNRIKNPADIVSSRYPGTTRKIVTPGQEYFEEQRLTIDARSQASGGDLNSQRSPSLSITPTVRPPYRTFDDNGKYVVKSESLSTVHSLRQPYSLQDPTGTHVQRTPSVNAIPPNISDVGLLASLGTRPLEPTRLWTIGSTTRLTNAPLATDFRLWLSGDSQFVQAYLKDDKSRQISARIPHTPAAQPAQAEDIGYFPLGDGSLLSIDLTAGSASAIRINWRANVGGALNRTPLVVKDAVFQGGDTSGVVRVDRATGDVTWRTDETADTILALNDETVYVRDKQGFLRAYDRTRITDPTSKRALQLGAVNLSGFPVTAMNEFTDRIYLASSTGTLLCLRDKSSKYASALSIAVPARKPQATPKKADPAAAAEPKK